MSRPETGASGGLNVEVDHVCDYFGGDQDMASMFLDMLHSDVASGSTSEVRALLWAGVSCARAQPAPVLTVPPHLPPPVLRARGGSLPAGHCDKVLSRRPPRRPRLLRTR